LAWVALAPLFPEELFSDAVRATEQLCWAPGRGYVLAALAPRLPVALVQKALAIAEALEATTNSSSASSRCSPASPRSANLRRR
jgi:hypothetical protein